MITYTIREPHDKGWKIQEASATVPLTDRKQLVAIPSSRMIALSDESYYKVLQENRLSTHPDPANRITRLNKIMPKAMEYYHAR